MADKKQYYGIRYPFTNENQDEVYVDLDGTYFDGTRSRVLHVLFTQKGQRLRNPEFGTNLIKFLFEPSDDLTFGDLKQELVSDISRYVKNVEFNDIDIVRDENDDNHTIVMVTYTVKTGNKSTRTTVGVKI